LPYKKNYYDGNPGGVWKQTLLLSEPLHRRNPPTCPVDTMNHKQPEKTNQVASASKIAPPRYVIITPAYNEEQYIEKTIQSVLQQTVQPLQWLIVDDGSTDNTANIIKSYSEQHTFIHYCFREKVARQEYFASNVFAIMEAYEKSKEMTYDFLAVLDADIVLPANYYEWILGKFIQDPNLGVASGIYVNLIKGKLCTVLHDRRSTPKAIQVFRKKVFEEIGGFIPLKWGGEDTISCVMARIHKWKAWSFPDIEAVHLRPTGTGAVSNILSARFRQGICEYNMAVHPLFFLLKVLRRAILEKPYILGSILRFSGYLLAAVRRDKTILPDSVVAFLRKEQLQRVLSGNKINQPGTESRKQV